jgi:hypothetical protein
MSGSCKKAGRNKKSAANTAYKNGSRADVNRDRRAKREAKKATKLAARMMERRARNKPKRGDARKKRRAHLQRTAAAA